MSELVQRNCRICGHPFAAHSPRQTLCRQPECEKRRARQEKKAFRENHPETWRTRCRLAMRKHRALKKGDHMAGQHKTFIEIIPSSDEVRERLGQLLRETKILQQLLKVAERAEQERRMQQATRAPPTNGSATS